MTTPSRSTTIPAIDIDDSDSHVDDDWPKMADGSVFDDTELSALVRRGNRPF